MSRWHAYINSAKQVISLYKGDQPFSFFIKDFFSRHKKYGSGDRKQVSHLCYCWFRLGKVLVTPTEENILIALFLCSNENNQLLAWLKPAWNEKVTAPFEEKLAFLEHPFNVDDIFPWKGQLSEGIDATAFAKSHLLQPDLFLRIRPGKKDAVLKTLAAHHIPYTVPAVDCIALANTTKVDALFALNKDVVVQDYSSQRIAEFVALTKPATGNRQPVTRVWDCCAASGGKSILAHDVLGNIDLTVSDVRSAIIHNLRQRLKEAGIARYHAYELDLTKPVPNAFQQHSREGFDCIICDVPCSGSGTWGRTPEQLYYFTTGKIESYAVLQRKIATNVLPHIKPGGYFLYITCSVFKQENEALVDYIIASTTLQLVKKEVLIGYDKKADTMFAALLKDNR